MIFLADRLHATALSGVVCVSGRVPLALGSLYLSGAGRPSWIELQAACPIRFDLHPAQSATPSIALACERDFGDSHIHCHADGSATVTIGAEHQAGDPRHLPMAMNLAFALQWARLGHACVHGAMLEVDGCGVLILGQRGAGKSVLSTSALVAGGRIVSDDQLLVGIKDEQIVGERIRAFLSLRQSWAARTLFEGSASPWQANRRGSRSFLTVDENDARFPDHARIDQVWLLTRPRTGRQTNSRLEPVSQALLFAELVNATQPILLGPDFPQQRQAMSSLFTRLVSLATPLRLETGMDIVQNPRATWQRLLTRN